MENTVINAAEYRDLPLAALTESTTNPRRAFDAVALKELAESIRSQGVLSPLLVRPLNEQSFEIVAGARRYRAAQMAEVATVPVRVVNLTDAQALEAQLVENLMRRDVHPMEEANGYARLLALDEPKYSVEQIAVRVGKSPAYIVGRLKLTELAPVVAEAFTKDEIGVGHALLLAKLQPAQQEQALAACYQEVYGSGKSKRVLLPVRHLQQWMEQHVLLVLKDAPFSKRDAQLIPAAGSCLECPKRTGHNTLLFAGVSEQSDACSDPDCYAAKLDAHIKKAVAVKPKLVQITTGYGRPTEGSPVLPRGQYVEIHEEKPTNKYQQESPEFKTCKSITEAIITEGTGKGKLRKVCADPNCPVHHAKKQARTVDPKWKAEQEKQRRQEAIARTTGHRVLQAIGDAVPVRLMKRELLFIALQMVANLDIPRLDILAKLHHVTAQKEDENISKTVTAFLRRSSEGTLGRVLVEMAILLRADSPQTGNKALAEAAKEYNVSVDTIAAAVSKEFAERDKAKTAVKQKPPAKKSAKPTKAA